MGFLHKEPYECKMLETYKIDIEKTNNIYKANNPNGKSELGTQREYCELIAESSEYNFYSYRTYSDGSGGYVLRQDKQNPMNVVYFGDCKIHNCVFHGYLFQVNRSGEIGRFGITGKNIQTGEIRNFSWLSDKANTYVINGFGRFYCQDSVNKVFIKDGKLVFKITRKKSDYSPEEDNKNNKYDVDTDYDLVISYAEGKLKATAVYPANIGKTSKSSNQCLGRDVSKQLRCEYKGHEKDCGKKCEKCAIHIKDTADIALSKNRFDEALPLYKKAAFIEPHYADVWVSLGGIYKDKSEYKKALDAFERAIAIDKVYGEAIFGKAIVLQKLGHLEEALNVTKDLLSMYNNPDVISFKKELIDLGAKDVLRIDDAIDIMTNKAREIASENDLLDENGKVRTERAIYKKNEFAKQIFDYCKKKYASLGEEKVRSESIITSFYASLCTTLFYYKDKYGFVGIHPFEYINDHIDLEKADATAEHMLEMKSGDAEAEALWNMIYDYAQFSGNIISQVDADDVEAAIVDVTESAYVLGMLYAMRFAQKQTSNGRKSIGFALEKSAESSKDYAKSSPRSTTDTISTTKTKLELDALTFKYLTIISEGYESGDFSQLFPFLSRNCVFESQWVMTPNEGYDAVVSYLTEKGKTLKKTGSFPSCSIQELVGNINAIKNIDVNVKGEKQHGSIGLYYHAGELCLLMEQTIGDNSNDVILRIKLDEKEKISRIDLCMPELFQYREFYTFVSLYPCNGEEELETGRIRVSEPYYSELYLFLGMTGEEFDEYDDIHIPMEKWIKFLDNWKRFYSFKTFDEAFEDACGIDYNEFTVKDEEARRRLSYSGSNIWKNRSNNSNMLNDLLEWTEKYKDTCDYINSYGF